MNDKRTCQQCDAVRYGWCPCKKLCKDCELAKQEERKIAREKMRSDMWEQWYVWWISKKMAKAMWII